MTGRKYLVAGNWKMNGTLKTIQKLLDELCKQASRVAANVELVIFPPAIFLSQAQTMLQNTKISWGAQDVNEHGSGAHTGETDANMLLDFGCRYVIIGHSERRQFYGDTNQRVAEKFHRAMQAGLIPIVCVGETLEQREAGKTLEIVQQQLAVVLDLHHNLPAFTNLVIAYEPVWAIGTGKNATPNEAQSVHAAIRKQLKSVAESYAAIRIIYGGSVKPDNATSLLSQSDIDGALVGGASLNAQQFIEIAKQCNPSS